MMSVVDALLVLFAVALLVPSGVLLVECAAALLPDRKRQENDETNAAHRVVVLIPANNEGRGLRSTLRGIQTELRAGDAVLVVADNCTDDTAEVARTEGANVIERFDSTHRGKGFALDCGIAHLSADPPDVVVVLDADCQVTPGSIHRLAECAVRRGTPVQAEDLITVPKGASPLASVSALAFLVRNHVRPTGLRRLGLPCQLMGTGMAFPWNIILSAPPAGSHLVEDMQMGIELASSGFAPTYCGDACITSATPRRTQAARGQRRRWEHGHISTLLERAPALIARGVMRRNRDLLSMGLDLLVPPLALLVMLLVVFFVIDACWLFFGGSMAPFALIVSALAFVAAAVLLAWGEFGKQTLPARHLLRIPLYIFWKIPLYLSFLVRGPYASWERAERSASGF